MTGAASIRLKEFAGWAAIILFALVLLSCTGGSSTDTDNMLTDNTSTDTDNGIQVSLLDQDSTFDSTVTFVVSADNTADIYLVTETSDTTDALEAGNVFVAGGDTLVDPGAYSIESGVVISVLDENGAALEGAVITLRDPGAIPDSTLPDVTAGTFTADSNGLVYIPELDSGSYLVTVDNPSDTLMTVVPLDVTADQVQIATVNRVQNIQLNGRVVRQSGLDPGGIRVYIKGTNLETHTDSQGKFDFGELSIVDPQLGFVVPTRIPDVAVDTVDPMQEGLIQVGDLQKCPLLDSLDVTVAFTEVVEPDSEEAVWTVLDIDTANCQTLNGVSGFFGFGDTISLSEGETFSHLDSSITLTYNSLVSDNRCPSDVTCVTMGDGVAGFTLTLNSVAHQLELHTDPALATDTLVGGFRFSLLELLPVPVSTVETDSTVAVITVTEGK